jgi:hypothetical protein
MITDLKILSPLRLQDMGDGPADDEKDDGLGLDEQEDLDEDAGEDTEDEPGAEDEEKYLE